MYSRVRHLPIRPQIHQEDVYKFYYIISLVKMAFFDFCPQKVLWYYNWTDFRQSEVFLGIKRGNVSLETRCRPWAVFPINLRLRHLSKAFTFFSYYPRRMIVSEGNTSLVVYVRHNSSLCGQNIKQQFELHSCAICFENKHFVHRIPYIWWFIWRWKRNVLTLVCL